MGTANAKLWRQRRASASGENQRDQRRLEPTETITQSLFSRSHRVAEVFRELVVHHLQDLRPLRLGVGESLVGPGLESQLSESRTTQCSSCPDIERVTSDTSETRMFLALTPIRLFFLLLCPHSKLPVFGPRLSVLGQESTEKA